MHRYRTGQQPRATLQPFGPHGYTVIYQGHDPDLLQSPRSFQVSLDPAWMSRLEIGPAPSELQMHLFPRTDLIQATLARPPRYGR